jgi:hypothetical protein
MVGNVKQENSDLGWAISKIIKAERAGGVAGVVENLPSNLASVVKP